MKDFALTEHFTFYELTKTSNKSLQQANREEGLKLREKLKEVAELLEKAREALKQPVEIHSGFRCPQLNSATVGSSERSQHMKAEAADLSLLGPDTAETVDYTFRTILSHFIERGVMFGQLIRESAKRDYGRVHWVHVSLGTPHREIYRCGQVLDMKDGKYELLKRVPVG